MTYASALPTPRGRLRRVRLLGAIAVLAATASPWAGPVHAAGPCTGVSDAGRGWVALAPPFSSGDAAVRFYSAPAFQPDLIYAANDKVVMRTEDAGCTWQKVYEASTSLPLATAEITGIFAPSSGPSSRYVYVGVTSRLPAGLTSPAVAASARFGDPGSWTTASSQQGLPLLGTVTQLAASPQNPTAAFAVVENNAGVADRTQIFATQDAGASWVSNSGATGRYDGTGLLAHPSKQTYMFALQSGQVQRSTDTGATFSAVPQPGKVSSFSGVGGGGGAILSAALDGEPAYSVSTDDGNSWDRHVALGVIDSLATQPISGTVVYSAGANVVLESRASRLFISPTGDAPNRLALSAQNRDGFEVSGLRTGKILQVAIGPGFIVTPPRVGPDGEIIPVRVHGSGDKQFPTLLNPADAHVALPPGGTTVLPYDLLIPRTPTPVDVNFLVDTTGSMSDTINGLRKDLAAIVTTMDASGLNAEFGLGDFQDYPWNGNGDHAYRLDRQMGPADSSMTQALNRLTIGDGGDGPESDLTALLQSTTGQGDFAVAEGQQTHYRANALRLAFVATDSPYHKHGDQNWNFDSNGNYVSWPGPGWDETIAALNRAHVHQIGLEVSSGAYSDMARAALDTDTKAPDGGVDCNGDGTAELKAGDPMVCDISKLVTPPVDTGGLPTDGATNAQSAGITAAVVALANGIPDLQRATLRVTQGQRFAKIVSGSTGAVLNFHADNRLGYQLQLHCPVGAPSRQQISLDAATRVRSLATAHVVLDCGGVIPKQVPGPPPGLAPVAAVAAAPAAPAAPAQPITNPQPNPNPNSNPQANANVNANSGFVEQTQEEAQLALAVGDMEGLPTERGELAMSARRQASEFDLGFVAAAALLTSAAFGVSLRARSRASTCSA